MCRFFAVTATLCLAVGTASADTIVGPLVNPVNGHAYYLLPASSWQDARAQAHDLGGNLATINDADEQAWVFSTFGSYGGQDRSLWIGLSDVASPGNFLWVSGEPVTYTNWQPGQPDYIGIEHYVHMIRTGNSFGHPPGTWNNLDGPGFAPFDPLCGVVEVSGDHAVIFGPVINPANGHSYYLLTGSSWHVAQASALLLGGNLVTINDAAEQEWVFSTFGSWGGQDRSLWIGLNDEASEGNFVWVSGEPVTYTLWQPGQPDNNGNEDYAHMIRTGNGFGHPPGTWNDLSDPETPFTQFDPIQGVVEVSVEQIPVRPTTWGEIKASDR